MPTTELPRCADGGQFRWLFQHHGLWQQFCSFLAGRLKFVAGASMPVLRKTLEDALRQNSHDRDIYTIIHRHLYRPEQVQAIPVVSGSSTWRADNRAKEIQRLLSEHRINVPRGKALLDMGCAEGSITAILGQELGFEAAHTYGADVRDIPPSADFVFQRIIEDAPLPFEDNKFYLVFALMVLHHIPNYPAVVAELIRVLEPGGFLIIREHDCSPAEFGVVLDLIHGLYALALKPAPEDPTFTDTYWASYLPQPVWLSSLTTITQQSYQLRTITADRPWGPQRIFFAIFQKVPLASVATTGTRAPRRQDSPHPNPARYPHFGDTSRGASYSSRGASHSSRGTSHSRGDHSRYNHPRQPDQRGGFGRGASHFEQRDLVFQAQRSPASSGRGDYLRDTRQ
jgi:SAM-dependent methyltransferase